MAYRHRRRSAGRRGNLPGKLSGRNQALRLAERQSRPHRRSLSGVEQETGREERVNELEDMKIEIIPSITHVDGTCRIQTVSQEDNEHYYNLIKEFKEKTGVPILFNTSFNLAGDPLVETVLDAIDTLEKSEIKYLYLPEIGKLIYKK